MKLVVKRATREMEDKGFFGKGKEKIHRKFDLEVRLQDLDENTLKMFELYTYLGEDGKRHRYTELPIMVHSDPEIIGPSYVRIQGLMNGESWTAPYLSEEFANIPYAIAGKIEEIIAKIQLGKLWGESKHEEIEIKTEPPTK